MPEITALLNCYTEVKKEDEETKLGRQVLWLMPPPALASDEK